MTIAMERATRRWPRHYPDMPIGVIVHRAHKTRVLVGWGNELSQGGMALTAGLEMNPGEEAEFTPPYFGSAHSNSGNGA